MADLGNFDATQVNPTIDLPPLPAGKYAAVIVESEKKWTKANNGQYLELVFEITNGEHQGRKLWSRLNIDNPNPKAEVIARANLSAICHAVGVLKPQDSADLHDIPLMIKVTLRKRDDTGEFTNEVKGYSAAPPSTAVADAAPVGKEPSTWPPS